jgi:hypothetical protein
MCQGVGDTYVSHEALNRTTEGTTYVSSPNGDAVFDAPPLGREVKGDFRDSKEVQTPSPEVPLSVLQRQCYDLARAHAAKHDRDPGRNEKLVTMALNGGKGSIEEVLAELGDAFESGEDLGEALSWFWMDEWRSWG